jgi:asparagine synthase (glutamine-hydrolysing)
MANSIEIRLPFLDYRLIELASSLPAHWKIRGLNEKSILKRAYREQLPGSICKRSKQPYRAPISEAFCADRKETYVDEMLSEKRLRQTGLFHEGRVRHLTAKLRRGCGESLSENQSMAFVGILSTQLLHHHFVENFTGRDVLPAQLDKVVRNESDVLPVTRLAQ